MEKLQIAAVKSVHTSELQKTRYSTPFISYRNRLSSRPRTEDFSRSLRAEVEDPLWMISRQWQLGEFQGEDTGTAFQAQIFADHRQPQTLSIGGEVAGYHAAERPLEVVVEREKVQRNLYRSVEMARYLHRVMNKLVQDHNRPLLLKLWPVITYTDIKKPVAGAYLVEEQDKEAWLLKTSVEGRLPNGEAILEDMQKGAFIAKLIAQGGLSAADKSPMEAAQTQLLNWAKRFYEQPVADENAWVPERLEYSFSLQLPAEKHQKRSLLADEYTSGHLDWYDFDEIPNGSSTAADPAPQQVVQTFIPAPLRFSGMPHPRYWQMEESRTDFGKIDTSPTGLLTLLLAEYGLTYSNDWFVLPYEMNINTLCEVKGILIRDNFGFYSLITPTVDDPEQDWRQFATFHNTERRNLDYNRSRFFLPPAVGKVYESDPVEKVNFMRDEMANMAWGIEHTVPSPLLTGWKQNRQLVSRLPENFRPQENKIDPNDPAKIQYILGSTVPDNWIPFIPVRKEEGSAEIRLQRARMPQAHPPRGMVLSEKRPPYFIEEEEVSRAGVIVERRWQRTRWLKGRSFLWMGRRKMAGLGEGWSGLMFDQIIPIKKEKEEVAPV